MLTYLREKRRGEERREKEEEKRYIRGVKIH
jgi:hypothetical protein